MHGDKRTAWIVSGTATLFLLIILVLAVSSSDGDLDGTDWMVDRLMVDGDETTPIDGTTMTIAFTDGMVSGSSGCNNYQGNYEVDGDGLILGPLAATQRFCDDPPGVSDQELVFLGLLGAVDSFSIEGDELVLKADGTASIVVGPLDR